MDKSLSERAYTFIRKSLIAGKYPPGSRLNNRALATEIGVSAIPVREALNRLASERLVEYWPGQGTFVPERSRHEIQEMYELREILECHAVVKVCGRLSNTDLAKMTEYVDQMSAIIDQPQRPDISSYSMEEQDRLSLADAGFHVVLLEAAGNRRVQAAVEDVQILTQTVAGQFRRKMLEFGNPPAARDDHRRILDALRRGDGEEARRVMAEHIRSGCRQALAAYDRDGTKEKKASGPLAGPHGRQAGKQGPDELKPEMSSAEESPYSH